MHETTDIQDFLEEMGLAEELYYRNKGFGDRAIAAFFEKWEADHVKSLDLSHNGV